MSLIIEDHLIYSCTQKFSLSFLVTTVWTLEASTCGPPPLSSKWGHTRPADDDLLTMEILAVHEQFLFSPFTFNSFYQVGIAVCRTCGCQISTILHELRSRNSFEKVWKEGQILWGSRILDTFLRIGASWNAHVELSISKLDSILFE